MDLVRREPIGFCFPDVRDESLDGRQVLGTGICANSVPVGPQNAIDRQFYGLAENVPQAAINRGRVGTLATPAFLGHPLGGDSGQIEGTSSLQYPPSVFEPPQVAPVGVPVAIPERVVALDPTIGDDGGKLCVGIGAPTHLGTVQDVDLDLFDRQVRQVRRLHTGRLGGGENGLHAGQGCDS